MPNFAGGGGAPVTSAAPSGAAGGDLSGTYPSPTVTKLNGTALTTTPPFVPFPITTTTSGTNTNTQSSTFYAQIRGSQLLSFPSTWKMKIAFLGGSPVIGALVVKRTLTNSTTVVDTTPILIAGVANPTLASPGIVTSDAVSLALDATHDYYLEVFFTSAAANTSVVVNWPGAAKPGYTILFCGSTGSDITASSTAPSTFTAGQEFLFVGIFAA